MLLVANETRGSFCCAKFIGRNTITLSKLECSKQAVAVNTSAWNNKRTTVSRCWCTVVMTDRNSWGHSYSTARGEILRFVEDELMRKHLPRMFSLVKNES